MHTYTINTHTHIHTCTHTHMHTHMNCSSRGNQNYDQHLPPAWYVVIDVNNRQITHAG